MIKKEFKTIVSLASTHIDFVKKNKNPNCIEKIVCSVMYYEESINLIDLVKNSNLNTMNYKKFMVINLGRYLSYKPLVKIDLENLKFIDLNIHRFIKMISRQYYEILQGKLEEFECLDSKPRMDYSMDRLGVGNKNFNKNSYFRLSSLININLSFLFKTENNRSLDRNYNLIFIFNDITWKNIVFLFKLNDIDLYGGSSNKRHLLSTVHVNLVNFLLLMNNNELDYNLIYKSFNSVNSNETKIDRGLLKYIQSVEHLKLVNLDLENPFAELNLDCYENIEDMRSKFLIKENIFLIFYTALLRLDNEISILKKKISEVSSEIELDKERFKKYSTGELNNFDLKKIKSIEKRNSINNSKHLELNNEVQVLRNKYNTCINLLKILDSSYFDEEGICKIDSNIRVNTETSHVTELGGPEINENTEEGAPALQLALELAPSLH